MDLCLSQAERVLQDEVAQTLGAEVTPDLVRRAERGEADSELGALWSRLAALGYLGLAVPESQGGVGGSIVDLVLLVEQAGRVACPGPLADTATSARILAEAGRDEALAALLDGSTPSLIGWSESDADQLEHLGLAETAAGVVTGTKISLAWAGRARGLIAFGRARSGEPAAFRIDLRDGAVKTLPRVTIGQDACLDVVLDGAAGEALSGDRAMVERWRDLYFSVSAAWAVGLCDRATEQSLAFVRQREQFGRPVGSYQAVQRRCVEMSLVTEGARYLTYRAAFLLDRERDASLAAAMAQAYTASAIEQVCRHAHQVHGAIGFTRDLDLQLYTRRAKHHQAQLGGRSGRTEAIARGIGLG